MNDVHFSSKTVEWETPKDFFEKVNAEFLLDSDVCATLENRKREAFWSKEDNALSQDWSGIRGWMNPPYGTEIAKWVEKAATGGA